MASLARVRGIRKSLVALLSAFAVLVAAIAFSPSTVVVAAPGDVYTGTVFIDYNGNGQRDTAVGSGSAQGNGNFSFAFDEGVPGVTVTLYDASDNTWPVVTDPNGDYSITVPAGFDNGPYRIEFTGYTNFFSTVFENAAAADSQSSVRFVPDGGGTGINFGISNVDVHCPTLPNPPD
ncbi:MAG: hypothetical protein GYB68_04380, partial [Chloroflexi bacterium]|nr:hypothetical protein [Chloroflexota bacterium]